jgi:hypothetical protein
MFLGNHLSSAIDNPQHRKVLMTTLKVSAGVQVASGGPAITLAAAIGVEAYTKIEFVLTDKAPTKPITLGKLGETIQFVVIKADLNDSDAAVKPKLTYKDANTTKANEFTLDAPHLYMGPGFVKALAGAGIDFSTLTFTFEPLSDPQATKSVKVEILVGGPAKPA